MDKKALLDEIQRLPPEEQMDIVDALLDSTTFDESPPPVSSEQMRELGARLAHHRLNPNEPTALWTRFVASSSLVREHAVDGPIQEGGAS